MKPSFNARGLGVFCTSKLNKIIQPGKKTAPKVVQKYVEKPFLLNGKKFDVRQWVLVTSWEPLECFIFEQAYLRVCAQDFTLNELDNAIHVTNYSIQKADGKTIPTW